MNDRFREKYGLKSQLLHAYRLEFPELDGALKEVSGRAFIAEEPILFQKIAKTVSDKMTDKDYINNGNMAY